MKLATHLSQGRLVYLSQQQDAMTVNENDYYRWMAFNDVVQSVMLIRKPSQLTLPHHIAVLLPLLFFKPKKIVELGLGGGNLTRFLHQLSEDISLTTIEHSQVVIDSFKQYFNPECATLAIVCDDGMSWLQRYIESYAKTDVDSYAGTYVETNTENDIDFIICDVYQSQTLGFNVIVKQLEIISMALNSDACASINLPDISDSEIQLCLTILQQLNPGHRITHFAIPSYLNIVMHLTPKHWPLHRLIKKNKHSYLSSVRFNRWKRFWQHGIHTS